MIRYTHMHKHEHHHFVKAITTLAIFIAATIVGYLLVYWWVFGNGSEIFSTNALRSQIIATQQSNDVKSQLQELGYSFQEDQFFHLSGTGTSTYHADVLGGYDPQPVEEEPSDESYYFYDENGNAFFFTVGEDGQVDPKSFVPLIQH